MQFKERKEASVLRSIKAPHAQAVFVQWANQSSQRRAQQERPTLPTPSSHLDYYSVSKSGKGLSTNPEGESQDVAQDTTKDQWKNTARVCKTRKE